MSKKFIHRRLFCSRGHSMENAEISIDAHGYEHRRCRTCRQLTQANWKALNQEAISREDAFYADKRAEKRWRFRMWEIARLSDRDKQILQSVMFRSPHITNVVELTCPVFVFELHGKKQKESLADPFPQW